MNLAEILIALLLGMAVGYVLQRGRGCTNTAFRNLVLFGNFELFLMIVVTVCIELIGYFLLSEGIFGFEYHSNPLVLSYLFTPLGGLIFGFGTVYAGGCAGGVCYRIGQGSISSLIALLGFGLGIALFSVDPLVDSFENLQSSTEIQYKNQIPSLTQFLPRWVWTALTIPILIFSFYYYYSKRKRSTLKLTHLLPNWNPVVTGVLLGVLGTLSRYFSTKAGRDFGLSTTDGIGQIIQALTLRGNMGWAGFLIVGLIFGSFIGASIGKEFNITIPPISEMSRFLFGGILLGSGAMLASGCNFGHIFGGLPELGISSIIALIFMVLGNWIGSQYYYIRQSHQLPDSTPILA